MANGKKHSTSNKEQSTEVRVKLKVKKNLTSTLREGGKCLMTLCLFTRRTVQHLLMTISKVRQANLNSSTAYISTEADAHYETAIVTVSTSNNFHFRYIAYFLF